MNFKSKEALVACLKPLALT